MLKLGNILMRNLVDYDSYKREVIRPHWTNVFSIIVPVALLMPFLMVITESQGVIKNFLEILFVLAVLTSIYIMGHIIINGRHNRMEIDENCVGLYYYNGLFYKYDLDDIKEIRISYSARVHDLFSIGSLIIENKNGFARIFGDIKAPLYHKEHILNLMGRRKGLKN